MADLEEQQRQAAAEQDKLKLLRLESEFYRSCNVIRQNGVELQKLRSCLVQELYDLEVRKRIRMDKTLNKKIEELQVRQDFKENYRLCVCWGGERLMKRALFRIHISLLSTLQAIKIEHEEQLTILKQKLMVFHYTKLSIITLMCFLVICAL